MKPLVSEGSQASVRLAEQLDALAGMPTADLRKQWARFYKTQPPKRMSRDLMLLAVGWKLQARTMGGLNMATRRKLIEMASKQDAATSTSAIRLKPGTRLVREWHGQAHEVLVLEDAFEWRGRPYRSFSKIAREITGAHWSGPRFFGLKPKPDNFARPGGPRDAE